MGSVVFSCKLKMKRQAAQRLHHSSSSKTITAAVISDRQTKAFRADSTRKKKCILALWVVCKPHKVNGGKNSLLCFKTG